MAAATAGTMNVTGTPGSDGSGARCGEAEPPRRHTAAVGGPVLAMRQGR
jgi:hypothetical protein